MWEGAARTREKPEKRDKKTSFGELAFSHFTFGEWMVLGP
jgi:hypothetical protein